MSITLEAFEAIKVVRGFGEVDGVEGLGTEGEYVVDDRKTWHYGLLESDENDN